MSAAAVSPGNLGSPREGWSPSGTRRASGPHGYRMKLKATLTF
jgi:hypothetical protein